MKIYNLSTVEGINPDNVLNNETDLDKLYVYINTKNGVNSSVKIKSVVKQLSDNKSIVQMINEGLIDPKNKQDFEPLLNLLKKQNIFGLIDISLYDGDVKVTQYNDEYKVSLLLPKNLRTHNNLSVLYKGTEKVEVFKVDNNGDWITFTTDHFSDFYLIGDKLVDDNIFNIWWLLITMIVIIILEIIAIIILKFKSINNKTYSLVSPIILALVPNNSIIWLVLLSLIIMLLAVYIIYLILKINDKNKIVIQARVIEASTSEESPKKEVISKLSVSPQIYKNTEVNIKPVPVTVIKEEEEPIYSYSFIARLHMADQIALDRFNELKNYVLSYEGVTASTTWGQETYVFKNKSIFKVRVNGKTVNIFFNLKESDFKDTKYIFIDRSNVKSHSSTPLQYIINGPRKLEWAKELIDYYMKEHGGIKKEDYINVDYKVETLSKDTLIDKGLIKVSNSTKGYENMIADNKTLNN